MKLGGMKSNVAGECECCGEPVYQPSHEIARAALEAIPEGKLTQEEAQAVYDEVVAAVECVFVQLDEDGDEPTLSVN